MNYSIPPHKIIKRIRKLMIGLYPNETKASYFWNHTNEKFIELILWHPDLIQLIFPNCHGTFDDTRFHLILQIEGKTMDICYEPRGFEFTKKLHVKYTTQSENKLSEYHEGFTMEERIIFRQYLTQLNRNNKN